jgi:hypothetical protein
MSSFIIKTREKTYTDDGSILYGLKPNATPENIKKIKNFFANRIYKNQELNKAKTGIYTWIIKTDGSLYATKTFSKQELGTLHINLKMLTNDEDSSDVFAAGELELVDEGYGAKTVIFNLLSGTYMASKFKKIAADQQITFRNSIVSHVENILLSFGLASVFLECSSVSCSDEEKLGGTKILENADIKTSPKKIAILNELFVRRGGRTRKRSKARKSTQKKRK